MDRTLAALAGLLHDIGKFWQRAAASPDQPLASGYEAFRRLDDELHHAPMADTAHMPPGAPLLSSSSCRRPGVISAMRCFTTTIRKTF